MTILVQLTDLHLVAEPPEDRADPIIRTRRALDHIAKAHPDADGLILTGDLTDRGEPAAFQQLAEALSDYPLPYWMVPGNHDSREAMAAAFPDAFPDRQGPFLQRMVDLDDVSILLLDTHEPGMAGGTFCPDRAAQARTLLAARTDRPVVVALHHPPLAVGLPFMDLHRLEPEGAARLRDALAVHPSVLHLLAGHLHRPVFARWAGHSVSTLFGPNHQLTLDFDDPGVCVTEGPGAYGILRVDPSARTVVLHQATFTDEWPGKRVI